MSTTYRIAVHCDDQASDRCAGFIETVQADVLTAPGVMLDRVTAKLAASGWLRGYSDRQTYDVCPACAAAQGQPIGGDDEQRPGSPTATPD
jgi:hypothetical protein